jgi:hypothetical protein
MSAAITQQYGTIDMTSALDIMRNLYQGQYNIWWWFMVNHYYNAIPAWWQWSACPSSGDMLVSYASSTQYAYETTVVHVNLFSLLEAEPS